jgi:diaminopimelate decarboxylase
LIVIDLDALDAAIARFRSVCDPLGVDISYAAKAFICTAFAGHLGTAGIGLDVCSMGELLTAERAGFPPERLTLHGCGKADEELQAAASGRVAFIAVDGIDELAHLARLAHDRSARILLRLNTGIEAHTHAFVRTGGDDTKFGLHPRDEERAANLLTEHPHLRFAGLHAHVGSQIYAGSAFVANADALVEAAERFASRGLITRRIVVGGGFGVPMRPDAGNERLDLPAVIRDVARRAQESARARAITVPQVGIEPGRSIVADAGTTLYRVLAIKRQSHRTFVVVDGGMYENPRPALYGAYHHVVPVEPRTTQTQEVTLCGRSCENDELGTARLPQDVRAGDLLAMQTTGAYTRSMAGNYNRFSRPAVVAARRGQHRLWVRRETLDDVLHLDES